MKKIIGLFAVLLVLFAMAGCSKKDSGAAGSAAPIKWKMTTIYVDVPEGTDPTFKSLGASMRKFTADVNAKSNGRLEITGFYNAVLGSANDTFQQMERGETQIYYGQPMSAIDSRFAAWSLPYLFRDYDEVDKILNNPESELYKISEKWIGDYNGKLLSMGITCFRGIFNTKHRVVKVSDLNDLRIRTYEDPIVNSFWAGISQAMPIPISEVYTALQTKSIDGLEFTANSVLGRKYNEVGKFYSTINWQYTNGATMIVNKDAFNKLPADLQKLVMDCAREATASQAKQEIADEGVAFKMLRDSGVEVYEISPAELQDWVKYATSLSAKLRTAVGAEVYDEVIKIVEAERAKL